MLQDALRMGLFLSMSQSGRFGLTRLHFLTDDDYLTKITQTLLLQIL